MTKQTRRKFTPEFKAKVALEAAKEQLTLAQLSQKFEVNAVTISKWKSEFLANLSATFSNVKETENSEPEVPVEKLFVVCPRGNSLFCDADKHANKLFVVRLSINIISVCFIV